MQDLFLSNYSKISFLNKIKDSLKNCVAFDFSVSFIKISGLNLLKKELTEALDRGAYGRFITSTYQNFTDVASLSYLKQLMNKYPNFECHLDLKCFGDNGYHTKGYLFEYAYSKEFIVGSTNITQFALCKNIEWNVSLTSNSDFNSIIEAKEEFDKLFNQTYLLDEDIINKYKMMLSYAIEKWDMDYFDPESFSIKPNYMQRKALKELRRYRDLGVTKALVISATGSGKTYLAAMDARNFDAKRLLYIVHRESILKDAIKSFEKVFGANRSYGLFTGSIRDEQCDFVFASTMMLLKHLDEFDPQEFDYIIYDEAHHIRSDGGIKIYEYFKPSFLLGATATPERMDNKDIFSLFDQNVPFELRLRDAILNDLIVPFHYYGIRDQLVDYSYKEANKIAKEIANANNVRFIQSEIEKHRLKNEKLKAIAFCTNIAHSKTMAEELSYLGYNTTSLTGVSNVGERIKAFNDLQDESKPLEIICCVDILNEGVDIPKINMVLFLRPTESQTIFIQQLGRGLRKALNKEYLTVLDFIGNNYARSTQIALALGSLSRTTYMEKRYLLELIENNYDNLNIPGLEIHIDTLSKEEIKTYIKNENFNSTKYLQSDYNNFKNYLKLDTYPTHMDFLNSELAPNLIKFLKAKINGKRSLSYYAFLKNIGEKNIPIFTDKQINLLNNISKELPLTRADEYIIIKQILNSMLNFNDIDPIFTRVNDITLNQALNHLKYKDVMVLNDDNTLNVDKLNDDFIEHLNDLLDYGLNRYLDEFGDFEGQFKLYCNYDKNQIALNLGKEYTMDFKQLGTCYIGDNTYCFVGLLKDKDKLERVNYKDKFLNNQVFQWESKKGVKVDNNEGIKLQNTKTVHLFIRKMDEEDGIKLPFTYFGTGKFTNMRESYVFDSKANKKNATLIFDIILDNQVDKELYLDFEIEDI